MEDESNEENKGPAALQFNITPINLYEKEEEEFQKIENQEPINLSIDKEDYFLTILFKENSKIILISATKKSDNSNPLFTYEKVYKIDELKKIKLLEIKEDQTKELVLKLYESFKKFEVISSLENGELKIKIKAEFPVLGDLSFDLLLSKKKITSEEYNNIIIEELKKEKKEYQNEIKELKKTIEDQQETITDLYAQLLQLKEDFNTLNIQVKEIIKEELKDLVNKKELEENIQSIKLIQEESNSSVLTQITQKLENEIFQLKDEMKIKIEDEIKSQNAVILAEKEIENENEIYNNLVVELNITNFISEQEVRAKIRELKFNKESINNWINNKLSEGH